MADTLPTLVKEISQRRIDAYSVVRPRSIHTDEAWARAKGFRAPLAQAMMWCENQHGEKTAVGTASGIVSKREG
jgi:acyl dehydratase